MPSSVDCGGGRGWRREITLGGITIFYSISSLSRDLWQGEKEYHVCVSDTFPNVFLVYTATKIPVMYSFSGNCAASVPLSTFMCLWEFYILPGSVNIFSWTRIGRSIVGIHKSPTDTWMWKLGLSGLAIPFLGIFVSNFRNCFFTV